MNALAQLTFKRKQIMFDLEEAARRLDELASQVEELRTERDTVNAAIRSIVDGLSIERAVRLFARDAVELEVVQ